MPKYKHVSSGWIRVSRGSDMCMSYCTCQCQVKLPPLVFRSKIPIRGLKRFEVLLESYGSRWGFQGKEGEGKRKKKLFCTIRQHNSSALRFPARPFNTTPGQANVICGFTSAMNT